MCDKHPNLDAGQYFLPEDRFLDRELSWLEFNNRVLDLAKDKQRVPLLERLNFISIFSSNLDEYYMVRVAGLKRRISAGLAVRGVAGFQPRQLQHKILEKTRTLVNEQSRVFQQEIIPELANQDIHILQWKDLETAEKNQLHQFFAERVYPVLTPLAVDSSHPFPYVTGLSLNIGVIVRHPHDGNEQFARVNVPANLARFVQVSPCRFIPLEDVIGRHLGTLFSGMEIKDYVTFRVTRNENLEVEEDDAENLLSALEKELLRSRVGRPPVRLEVDENMDEGLLNWLMNSLDVCESEVFKLPAPLDLTGLKDIYAINREELKYPNFLAITHPALAEVETSKPADVFKTIQRTDVLLHHPYESFATSVQRFIEQAASDKKVLAIKQTLYRTSGDSPIVDALIDAAEAGKQVLAIVEIKARFDEERNIHWARKLERHGVHVVYGMLGLKTHCKLSMAVRDEGSKGLRRYVHIGTGNYHPRTARQYEDMGLLTCNPIITEDVGRLFNYLSGVTEETEYRRLLVAPSGIRKGILKLVDQEIANARQGLPSGIKVKTNSLVDEQMIDAFYRASQEGVRVDLWVRGVTCIRPQVKNLSENIRVVSILGRFLEHSRAYWFANAGNPVVGIGSADLMHRNLDRRVEVLVSLTCPEHIDQITSLFEKAFDRGTVSWRLIDNTWTFVSTAEDGSPLQDLQAELIRNARDKRK